MNFLGDLSQKRVTCRESYKGNPILLDKEGYIFKTNTKRGKKTYWCCRDYKLQNCLARNVTVGIHVKMWSNAHNHKRRTISRKNDSK